MHKCIKYHKDIDYQNGYYNVGSTIVCVDCMSETEIDELVFKKALENESLGSGEIAGDHGSGG